MTDDDGRDPVTEKKQGFGASRLMDSFLNSPLSGLVPWILLSVLAGPNAAKIR